MRSRSLLFTACSTGLLMLAGCAKQPLQPPSLPEQYPDSERLQVSNYAPIERDIYTQRDTSRLEVMRSGRYTLVSAEPKAGQLDLLAQIVQIKIPVTVASTVQEGLDYTLNHSGYRLCAAQTAPLQILFSRPLPAAHYNLGPMPLSSALQVLGGSSYQLLVDPVQREICFNLRMQTVAKELIVMPQNQVQIHKPLYPVQESAQSVAAPSIPSISVSGSQP